MCLRPLTWLHRTSGSSPRFFASAIHRVLSLGLAPPDRPKHRTQPLAAILPPGPAHVDLMHTLALPDNRTTTLASGFWAALPLDYFVRIAGKGDLRVGEAKTMPSGSLDHPLASDLLLRTMRLNCLTTAYTDLW